MTDAGYSGCPQLSGAASPMRRRPQHERTSPFYQLLGITGNSGTCARLILRLNQAESGTTACGLMEKPMTKSEITASLAETTGLTKEQVVQTLDALAELAYKNAKNSFTIPGLGKLVLVDRQARVGRNPATGEQINIPAKRVLKFRVAKAAKEAILGAA